MKKLLLALGILASSHLAALDVEIAYENNYISIMKVKIGPHEEVGLHRDLYPQLIYGIQGGTITRNEADGTTTDVVFPTGAFVTRASDPGQALHTSVNKSDEPVELLIVQHKDGSQKMRDAANSYIQFINRLSAGEQFDQHAVADSLLSTNCKKIFNGSLIASTSTQFVDDLLQLYNTYGSWKITPADIIISIESKTAVVRLFVDIPALGHFTEILLMRFDQNNKIAEINIVFNKVEDGYSFE